jgi:hypothetical protein
MYAIRPQQKISALSVVAHVLNNPGATDTNPKPPLTGVGTVELVDVAPLPSWPVLFLPQQYVNPFNPMAHV